MGWNRRKVRRLTPRGFRGIEADENEDDTGDDEEETQEVKGVNVMRERLPRGRVELSSNRDGVIR